MESRDVYGNIVRRKSENKNVIFVVKSRLCVVMEWQTVTNVSERTNTSTTYVISITHRTKLPLPFTGVVEEMELNSKSREWCFGETGN